MRKLDLFLNIVFHNEKKRLEIYHNKKVDI